jgi:hypothetical protein
MSGQGPYNGSYTPEGAVASAVLAALKNGTRLRGRVDSFTEAGTWVALELDGIGHRLVLVRRPWPEHYRDGQPIILQCVPDAARPGKYRFVVVEDGIEGKADGQ